MFLMKAFLAGLGLLIVTGCSTTKKEHLKASAIAGTTTQEKNTKPDQALVILNRGWTKAEGRESEGTFYARKFGIFKYKGMELRRNSINFVCKRGYAPAFIFDIASVSDELEKERLPSQSEASQLISLNSKSASIKTLANISGEDIIIQRQEDNDTIRKIFEIIYEGDTTSDGFSLAFNNKIVPSVKFVGAPDMNYENDLLGMVEDQFGQKLSKLTLDDITTGCGDALGVETLRFKPVPGGRGIRMWLGTGVKSLDEAR